MATSEMPTAIPFDDLVLIFPDGPHAHAEFFRLARNPEQGACFAAFIVSADPGNAEEMAVSIWSILANLDQMRHECADCIPAFVLHVAALEHAVGHEILDISFKVATFELPGVIGYQVDDCEPVLGGHAHGSDLSRERSGRR